MGEVGPDTLVDAYRMADLFVMPSTGEGFGIAFIEAMACGTPALGLCVCGARTPLATANWALPPRKPSFRPQSRLCSNSQNPIPMHLLRRFATGSGGRYLLPRFAR